MTLVLKHRVRYHETDPQGFMFNSRFLEVADVAMTEFFRSRGFPYLELVARGVDPSVVSAAVTFTKPARFEDELEVQVECTRVGSSSFDLSTRITADSDAVATLVLTYVNVDAPSATSRHLPDEVVRMLQGNAGPFS